MATKDVQLPEIGEGVNEGELVSWLVQPGDSVAVDQAIVELMTDKATVEVPSPIAGTVKELKFAEGDTVEVGATLITMEAGAAPAAEAPAPAPQVAPAAPQAAPASQAPAMNAAPSSGGMEMIAPPVAALDVLATPSTRRLAREMQVDINQIQGTGLAGRVTRDDIVQSGSGAPSMQAGAATPVTPYTPPTTFAGGEEKVPLKVFVKKSPKICRWPSE